MPEVSPTGVGTPALAIDLFGPVTLRDAQTRHAIAAPRAMRALAGCLALEAATRPVRREVLAEMLWPDCGAEASRQRLRTALWRLRQALGTPHAALVRHDPEAVWLDRPPAWTAAHRAFETGIAAACAVPLDAMAAPDAEALAEALALYAGPLMEGHDGAWIVPHRERFAELYARGLQRLLAWQRARGDAGAAAATAQRLLAVEPYREDLHAALIAHYAGTGQPGQALRQFDRCRSALEEDLGMQPRAAREALAAALARAGQVAAAASLTELPAPDGSPTEGLIALLERLDASLARLDRAIAGLADRLSAALPPADRQPPI